MNKLILGCVSAIALIGLAACSDTDETTTQSVPEQVQPLDREEAAPGIVPTEPSTPSAPSSGPTDAPSAQ